MIDYTDTTRDGSDNDVAKDVYVSLMSYRARDRRDFALDRLLNVASNESASKAVIALYAGAIEAVLKATEDDE